MFTLSRVRFPAPPLFNYTKRLGVSAATVAASVPSSTPFPSARQRRTRPSGCFTSGRSWRAWCARQAPKSPSLAPPARRGGSRTCGEGREHAPSLVGPRGVRQPPSTDDLVRRSGTVVPVQHSKATEMPMGLEGFGEPLRHRDATGAPTLGRRCARPPRTCCTRRSRRTPASRAARGEAAREERAR